MTRNMIGLGRGLYAIETIADFDFIPGSFDKNIKKGLKYPCIVYCGPIENKRYSYYPIIEVIDD